MEEKIALYGLAGLSIVIAAGLLVYRTYLISTLSNTQIEAIYGAQQDAEIEVGGVAKTLVKMRTHYPSLMFLVPAIVLSLLAYQIEIAKNDWVIGGSFVLPDDGQAQPDWRAGILTLFPSDLKQSSVGENGDFNIRVAIPEGKTFEETFAFVGYATFDMTHTARFSPAEELEAFRSDEGGLLSDMGEDYRFYDEVPVEVLPTESEVGG